jgi:hypothetical protein
MTEITRRLHAEIDTELDRLQSAADAPDNDEPELTAYETRLRDLHDAVVALHQNPQEDP